MLALPLAGAPMLRLSNTAVVATAAVGANAPPQTIQAMNVGEGALALSVSVGPGTEWLYASVQLGGNIVFAFFTASLPRGVYTATVTVSDPDAIDAPQFVTVTAVVGGGPPLVVDRYLAPGQTADITVASGMCFSAAQCSAVPGISAHPDDGGQWLSVATYAMGTIGGRVWNDYIHLAPAATLGAGTYTGTVALTSPSATDTIPVTMRLTTQPIAVPSTTQINLRLAQGGPAATAPFLPPITLSNSGMGTLTVEGAAATGSGIAAALSEGAVAVTADPGSLAPGGYDGSVAIQCNAANCPIQVPVHLEVLARGAPLIYYQGIADNATFAAWRGVAPGDIAVVVGEQLSFEAPVSAAAFPLPTSLGGTEVLINNVKAPLYYSSFGQVAFQVPSSLVPGTAVVQVVRNGEPGNEVSVNVLPTAPQIVAMTDAGYHLRDAAHPTTAGETLILWCIGLGATTPPVPDGEPAPASPLSVAQVVPQVGGLGTLLTPSFAGLGPGEAGVFQVIVTVPANTPLGNTLVTLVLPGMASRAVPLAVQ